MKKLLFILPLLLFAGLTGCVLTPHTPPETQTYDLDIPDRGQPQSKFHVSLFTNDTPSRSRMVYRKKNNQILMDEYNCWVQSPDRMLQRYLSLAFPLDGNPHLDKLAELRGVITAFELDMDTCEAVLAISYSLRLGDDRDFGTIYLREKLDTPSAASFAQAMSRAAAQACQSIGQTAAKFAADKQQ